MAKRAVVLLSGGMDSATCAFLARQEGYEVHTLAIDYGQRMPRELAAAAAIAASVGAIHHQEVAMAVGAWGGSSLTDRSLPLPSGPVDGEVPTTYVPARNLIFFSCAVSYAEVIGAEAVFAGLIADAPIYPDARPEFLVAFEQAARLGTQAGVEGRPIRLETPLLFLTKAQIVRLGTTLGVDFGLTWSCYQGGERPCTRCDACRLRATGFRTAGVRDPLLAPPG